MKVLLVHQNYPGQFKHLGPALVARGHQVWAITDKVNTQRTSIPTARYDYTVVDKKKVAEAGAPFAGHFAQMVQRGVATAAVARRLRDENGITPDVIFGHPGWGETLFLREVWPEARLLVYAEFWYRARGLDADFDPEFQKPDLRRAVGTLAMRPHMAMAMADADAALCPTLWQARTYPDCFQSMMEVIHDGVDTDALTPDPAAEVTLPDGGPTFRAGDELLTFISRNIEPYRGAHIFLRALPELLKARPEAQVVLIGAHGQGYGSGPPGGGNWKDHLLAEMGDRIDLSRVHFPGRIPYPTFCGLIRAARAHAYLTYPFVLSWSLLESMSMGAAIIASDTAPVREVIEDGVNGRLVDFFDVAAWSAALIEALENPAAMAPLRAAARQTILDRYALKDCLPRIVDLVERHGPR